MIHHTKNKGDLGVLKAQCDLAEKGFTILIPLTEHSSFDLVAYRSGKFYRIQVKYRTAKKGVIKVHFRSTWADRHGAHSKPIDKNEIDYYCVYCPDTDSCYYFSPLEFGTVATLRISPAKNGQSKNIRMAEDYRSI